jgi:predicted metal-dependent peptidase
LSRVRHDASKVAAARLRAANHMPYLASAVFATPVVAEEGCGTVAVDPDWRVHADPEVVDSLPVDELARLVLHLVGHLLREHADRAEHIGVAESSRAEAWNRATDAEINDDLAPLGLAPTVAPELPADLGQPPGRLAEAYYETAGPGRRWDCGSGCDGRPRPWDNSRFGRATGPETGLSGEQAALLRLAVAAAVQQAAGQLPGSVPGGWLRWAERVLPSRVDWRRLLAAEIRAGVASIAGTVDYTYRRPSRRAYVAPRVVLPSLYRPVPEVAVVCDTSGSMHEQLLGRVLAEVEGILAKAGLRSAQLRMLAVDTNVHVVRRVTTLSQVQLYGGGGTDMGAGIDAAAALRPKPSIVTVLTDGFTPWPERPPKGVKVIVGLLVQRLGMPAWPAPPWARTVLIDEG